MGTCYTTTFVVDHRGEVFERFQRVSLDECIHVGECGRHTAGQRRIAGGDLQRIHPHHTMCNPAQALHLFAEYVGVAAIPSIGQHHDDGSTRQPANPPTVVEHP